MATPQPQRSILLWNAIILTISILLILPLVPLLPITINGLLFHSQLFPWLQQIRNFEQRCAGVPRYQEIGNDEVINLGLRRPQYGALFPNDRADIYSDEEKASIVSEAMHRKAQATHPDKNGSDVCYMAAVQAAVDLCHRSKDQFDPYDCRREVRWRGAEFADHFEHSLCVVEREEEEMERTVSADIDAACNARELKLLARHGWVNWRENLELLLSPEFVWKGAVYKFFQLQQHRFAVPASCFYDGKFHYYTRLVSKEVPAPGPTALQWMLIWGTVVHVAFVGWLTWTSLMWHCAGKKVEPFSSSKPAHRSTRCEPTPTCDTKVKQPVVEPVVLTRRSRRLSCLPPEDPLGLFAH